MAANATRSIDAAIEHCRAITYRSRNNLAMAARRLPHPTQQQLFVTTYASMRVLDDYVDDFFLALEPPDRILRRSDAAGVLDRALAQVHAAVEGEMPSDSGAFEPAVFTALSHLLSRSDLPAQPWEALVASLARDVREEPIQTWDDYLAYCTGACIAPASVFIYVLGCEVRPDDQTRTGLPQPLAWYARDLAEFSYLVHMLRDLGIDAARNPQLLALPRQEIQAAGLSVDEVVRSARLEHWDTLRPLLTRVMRRADDAGARARSRMEQARPHFREPEWWVLHEIFQRYENAYLEARRQLLTTPLRQ